MPLTPFLWRWTGKRPRDVFKYLKSLINVTNFFQKDNDEELVGESIRVNSSFVARSRSFHKWIQDSPFTCLTQSFLSNYSRDILLLRQENLCSWWELTYPLTELYSLPSTFTLPSCLEQPYKIGLVLPSLFSFNKPGRSKT